MNSTDDKTAKNIPRWLMILCLQSLVGVYSFAGVLAKFASNHVFLSFKFFLFYGLEIAVLGIYALCWQQVLKRVELSVAYVNRAAAIIWLLVWSIFIFHDTITANNMIGVTLILIGVMVVNKDA